MQHLQAAVRAAACPAQIAKVWVATLPPPQPPLRLSYLPSCQGHLAPMRSEPLVNLEAQPRRDTQRLLRRWTGAATRIPGTVSIEWEISEQDGSIRPLACRPRLSQVPGTALCNPSPAPASTCRPAAPLPSVSPRGGAGSCLHSLHRRRCRAPLPCSAAFIGDASAPPYHAPRYGPHRHWLHPQAGPLAALVLPTAGGGRSNHQGAGCPPIGGASRSG